MKISPIPAGQAGSPGTNLGSVSTSTVSPDRVAAAKAAFLGEARVAESDNYVDPQVAKAKESIHKIKMRTNASPERYLEEAQAQEAAPEATQDQAQSAISDADGQTNATTEDTKPLSPQFAALAKQRRALQVKERELADREKALASAPSGNDGADIIARLKSQPLSVLQEHGVTYDQLTEAIIANQGGINPEIQALKAEIKALKEGVDKNFVDRDSAQEQAVLAEMRREADALAKQGDTYEMVRETNSLNDVMDLIHRTYKTSGEILDVSEAMQLVEDHLINESLKLANLKKIQGKLAPAQSAQSAASQQQQRPAMRTLTNRDTARSTMSREARALAAFNGTLKK